MLWGRRWIPGGVSGIWPVEGGLAVVLRLWHVRHRRDFLYWRAVWRVTQANVTSGRPRLTLLRVKQRQLVCIKSIHFDLSIRATSEVLVVARYRSGSRRCTTAASVLGLGWREHVDRVNGTRIPIEFATITAIQRRVVLKIMLDEVRYHQSCPEVR